MEKEFYNGNFERFIKERADEFRMIPSRRIWHSIYNNLHPSRRWPSILILILLLGTFSYTGYINTANYATPPKQRTNTSTFIAKNSTIHHTNFSPTPASIKNTTVETIVDNNRKQIDNTITTAAVSSSAQRINLSTNNKTYVNNKQTLGNTEADIYYKEDEDAITEQVKELSALQDLYNNSNSETLNEETANKAITKRLTADNKSNDLTEQVVVNAKQKKANTSTSIEFYATPSIGYRVFNEGASNSILQPMVATNNQTFAATTSDFKHKAALNIEAGFNFALSTSKRNKFKAGLQLNITNYNISGDVLGHPSSTLVAINNNSVGFTNAIGYAANNSNSTNNIHNTTYQLSLPVGSYYKVVDKKRFDVFVGASLQPTFIFGGNTNLLSADRKYYVNGSNYLRKWNMNTAAEAFIQYKVADINLIAGPQVRYQLFSTYKNNVSVNEKLYNIGFKIGVSKNF